MRTRLEKGEQYTADNYDDERQKLEIVCSDHNHDIITDRRKKGSLKNLK